MHLRSTIVGLIAAGSLLACSKKDDDGAAGAKPKPAQPAQAKGCGAVPDDVASWLTGVELGPPLGAEGSPEVRRWAERQDVYETVLVGAGYEAWCRDAPKLAKACLTVSEAADPGCKAPQEAILGLKLTRDCPANLAAEAANWITIAALGPQPAADGPARAEWEARSDADLARIDQATTETLCAERGGLPLRCMTSRESAECASLVASIILTMTPDAAAKPAP